MDAPGDPESRKVALAPPVVSDLDGTREGGVTFCVVLFGGLIAAAALAPGSLTSFWVWLGLLAMAAGVAVNVQMWIARLTGFAADRDET